MARSAKTTTDPVVLQAALEGFEHQRQRIDEQISQLRSLLGTRKQSSTKMETAEPTPNGGRRKLSAAARKRIAAAQKKRWAEFRKNAPASK
jgi:hypothetical protein